MVTTTSSAPTRGVASTERGSVTETTTAVTCLMSRPTARVIDVQCNVLSIYNFICHSMMTAKKKTKTNNNKQETETRLNINSHVNHIRSFRSRLAQPKTELHTELSIFINLMAYCTEWCRMTQGPNASQI